MVELVWLELLMNLQKKFNKKNIMRKLKKWLHINKHKIKRYEIKMYILSYLILNLFFTVGISYHFIFLSYLMYLINKTNIK